MNNDIWLTPEQLHEQYGFSLEHQAQLRRLKNPKKQLPYSKINTKTVRYLKSDVDAWLKSWSVKNG